MSFRMTSSVPALVVRGQRDPICRQRWAEEVSRRSPQGRLVVIPEVAHTLIYTAPRELMGRPTFQV